MNLATVLLLAPMTIVNARSVVPDLAVELQYATANNFLKSNLYGDFTECFLMEKAAAMLGKAQAALAAALPGAKLLAYDCLRPRDVQAKMWVKVRGTPQQKYVAAPVPGSVHGYGCAIDLTVKDAKGQPLDMGTPFDFFGAEAEPDGEIHQLRAGRITSAQVVNRLILRQAMVTAGFLPLPHEWWHFDCMTREELGKVAQPVESVDSLKTLK